MRRRRYLIMLPLCIAVAAAIGLGEPSRATARDLLIASTTSTENSGLFAHILPVFEAHSRIKTRVIAVGTGQALRLGRSGDADLLLVHDRAAEEAFVAAGYGVDRRAVMYNDFVLLGPRADPAGIGGKADAVAALRAIAASGRAFVSRGDDSGTHRAERRLWSLAAIDVASRSGGWYREVGAGMGAALNIAGSLNAYILSDRATWVSFRNKADLTILVAGDPRLFNQYGVIRVNPARHAHVNAAAAKAFADWIVSPAGQKAIETFRVDGRQLFFPNAHGS